MPDATAEGTGSRLYERLMSTLEAEPEVHGDCGGIAVPNDASIALHERLGFREVAKFSEVGFKFDQ